MKTKSLTVNQVCALIVVLTLSNKFLLLPSLMYNYAQNDAIFSILILFLINIGAICIFAKCAITYPNLTFREIIEKRFGKITFKIICIIFIILFFIKLTKLLIESEVFLNDSLYNNFPPINFILITMFVCGYLAIKGLKVLGRTSELFIKFVLIGVVIIVFLSISSANFDGILPLFVTPFSKIIEGSLRCAMWFGNYFILFLTLGHIDVNNKLPRRSLIALLIASLVIILFFIIFYCIFQNTSAIHHFAISEMTELSSTISSLTKVDWFSTIVWTLLLILQLSLDLFTLQKLLLNLFNVKNSTKFSYALYIILSIIYIVIPLSWEQIVILNTNILYILSASLYILFPLFMLITLTKHSKEVLNGKTMEEKQSNVNFHSTTNTNLPIGNQ